MESFECFSQLAENIPLWIDRVTELATHTAARHAEFSAEYAKLASGEVRSRRRKNSSLHTHRGAGEDNGGSLKSGKSNKSRKSRKSKKAKKEVLGKKVEEDGDFETGSHVMDPITLKRLTRQHPLEAMNRKRKTDEAASGCSNNNTQNSTAIMRSYQLVIHYDGHTQSILDTLVHDVVKARNTIRKCRMNHMMKSALSRRTLTEDMLVDDIVISITSTSRLGKSNTNSNGNLKSTNDGRGKEVLHSSFDLVDKELESAQNLWESAAHQFLRNGNCTKELNWTKSRLTAALGLAKSETERLRAGKEEQEREEAERAERAEMRKQAGEKQQQQQQEQAVNIDTTGAGTDTVVIGDTKLNSSTTELKLGMVPDTKDPVGLEIIEVDDNSDASTISIDIDISAIRANYVA